MGKISKQLSSWGHTAVWTMNVRVCELFPYRQAWLGWLVSTIGALQHAVSLRIFAKQTDRPCSHSEFPPMNILSPDEKHWRLVLGELEMVLPHMEGLHHPINTAARVTWWCSLPRLHQYTRSCTPSSWLVAYSWEGLWIVVQGLVLWMHNDYTETNCLLENPIFIIAESQD